MSCLPAVRELRPPACYIARSWSSQASTPDMLTDRQDQDGSSGGGKLSMHFTWRHRFSIHHGSRQIPPTMSHCQAVIASERCFTAPRILQHTTRSACWPSKTTLTDSLTACIMLPAGHGCRHQTCRRCQCYAAGSQCKSKCNDRESNKIACTPPTSLDFCVQNSCLLHPQNVTCLPTCI